MIIIFVSIMSSDMYSGPYPLTHRTVPPLSKVLCAKARQVAHVEIAPKPVSIEIGL